MPSLAVGCSPATDVVQIANYFLEHKVNNSRRKLFRLLYASTLQETETKPATYSISAVI